MLEINGQEFDFEVTCAEDMERFESAYAELERKAAQVDEKKDGRKISEYIHESCACTIDFFDAVLGAGAAQRILGPKTSLARCLDATEAFVSRIASQVDEMNQKLAQYSSHRLERHRA